MLKAECGNEYLFSTLQASGALPGINQIITISEQLTFNGLKQSEIVKVAGDVYNLAIEHHDSSRDLTDLLALTSLPTDLKPEEIVLQALGKVTNRLRKEKPEDAQLLYKQWFEGYDAGASTTTIHSPRTFHALGSACAAEVLLQSGLLEQPQEVSLVALAQNMLLAKIASWTLGASDFGTDIVNRTYIHFPIDLNNAPLLNSRLAISCQSPANHFVPFSTHPYNACPRE